MLANFLVRHTAGVSHGAEVIAATTRPTSDLKTVNIEVEYQPLPDGSAPTTHVGSAVPITEDGYLLTAAHCVMPAAPVYVVIVDRANVPRLLPARVVWAGWTGETGEHELDLAVLHVDNATLRPLPWASDDSTTPGARVYLNGQSGPSAGRIVSGKFPATQARDQNALQFRLIFHDAPSVDADSGGPLVSANGRLLGINPATYKSVDRSSNATLALRPDLHWLDSLISSDRAKRNGGRTFSPEKSSGPIDPKIPENGRPSKGAKRSGRMEPWGFEFQPIFEYLGKARGFKTV
ncbi:MAG: serine protease [Planctomycetota bacterium]|nr:serine protease [Planctomycetota bacterium]